MTCCDEAMLIAFVTGMVPAIDLASVIAWSAIMAFCTCPPSTTWLLLLETRMPLAPVLDTICSRRLSVSSLTSTSITLTSFLSASKIDKLVVPTFFP